MLSLFWMTILSILFMTGCYYDNPSPESVAIGQSEELEELLPVILNYDDLEERVLVRKAIQAVLYENDIDWTPYSKKVESLLPTHLYPSLNGIGDRLVVTDISQSSSDLWQLAKDTNHFDGLVIDLLTRSDLEPYVIINANLKQLLEDELNGLMVNLVYHRHSGRIAYNEREIDMTIGIESPTYAHAKTYLSVDKKMDKEQKDWGEVNEASAIIEIDNDTRNIDVDYIPMFQSSVLLLNNGVEGVVFNPRGTIGSGLSYLDFRYMKLKEGKTLVLAQEGFSPTRYSIEEETFINSHLYEGLMNNQNGEILPGVAEGVRVSEDRKVYTFSLRKDLRFSDGAPMNAHDYYKAWIEGLDRRSAMKWVLSDMGVAGVEAYTNNRVGVDQLGLQVLDDDTLEIRLKEINEDFLYQLNNVFLLPIQSKPLYNGPYLLTYQDEDKVVLSKNEYYWNADAIELEKIVLMQGFSDETERLEAFLSGEINLCLIQNIRALDEAVLREFEDHLLESNWVHYLDFLK